MHLEGQCFFFLVEFILREKFFIIHFSDGWRYNPGGIDQIFEPLSQNCTKFMFANEVAWSKFESILIVKQIRIC
jgi:hypothetical protein